MSHKAGKMSLELADELQKLLPTLICTQTTDSNGDPVITLSADATPATGEKVVVIRTKSMDQPLSKDSLGLPSQLFVPHVFQLCTEANFAGTTDNVADILTPVELLPVIVSLGKRCTRVEWYQSANGTVPATAQMVSANLKATIEADLYWGTKASQ
jgi:hypothetical protein